MGFQNSATGPDLGFLGGSFIFVDKAAKDGPTLDSLVGEVSGRVVGPGRVELAAAMGTTSVVMGLIPGQDRPQMPLAGTLPDAFLPDLASAASGYVCPLDNPA